MRHVRGSLQRIAARPYLQPVYPRLFSLVDFYCRQYLLFDQDPAARLEVIVPWHGIRDHVWGPDATPLHAPSKADDELEITRWRLLQLLRNRARL